MVGQFEATAPLSGLDDGMVVHAVRDGSPSTLAGILPRDIIFAINGKFWRNVRLLTFSDRHHRKLPQSLSSAGSSRSWRC
jgi:C-terminal processing protease CtpA/Prc